MNRVSRYYFNILLGIDEFANILLLGSPEETISSRLGRAFFSGKAKWFVYPAKKFVDTAAWILAKQTNHCVSSILNGIDVTDYELWNWIKD
jgi:hypothetical protein